MNALQSDLLGFIGERRFATVLVDPPWRFTNKTGKVAPEHRRLSRYSTLTLDQITALPVVEATPPKAHLYLWCPNALLAGGSRGHEGVGLYVQIQHCLAQGPERRRLRRARSRILFSECHRANLVWSEGQKGAHLGPGRRQVNFVASRKREHSRKPDEQYAIIEACSPGPYLELFARGSRAGWTSWGDQAENAYASTWKTFTLDPLVAAE